MPYYSQTLPHPSRDQFVAPPSLLDRLLAAIPCGLGALLQDLDERRRYINTQGGGHRIPRTWPALKQRFNARRLLSLPNLCILAWLLTLLWGERWVFESCIRACEWGKWERWPREATPHHLVFLADPQLIDPHTYPGRPWPLSTFTVLHTDNYMLRSYIQLQKTLHPDTIFFLGDLFDGGREWATRQGNSDDPAWAKELRPSNEKAELKTWKKKYGEDFWLREYNRFGKIFFNHWNDGGTQPGVGQRGRKIIASLPGNHDLGFGAQIKIPVRNRFEAYFGDTNRVDVVGNHTIVSVDSVSLSAGSTDQPEAITKEIYGPVDKFLKGIQPLKRKAVERELRFLNGQQENLHQKHSIDNNLKRADYTHNPTLDPGQGAAGFPTILLTHVPLYREPGTPCGPMREHWPPTKPPKGQTSPVIPDDRNAISISRGYQYQNVLSDADSIRLITSIGDVVSVFSGDDHDYCDIVHPSNKNNAREITVKSMSWAMGVRRPGFLMLSMWNPVDSTGSSIGTRGSGHGASSNPRSTTMESHLCLLPDQLGIFIRYLALLVLSLGALATRAILTPILNLEPFSPLPSATALTAPILPTSRQDVKRDRDAQDRLHSNSHSSTSSTTSNAALAPRSTIARTRSVSPAGGYGLPPSQATAPPLIASAGYFGPDRDVWDDGDDFGRKGKAVGVGEARKPSVLRVVWREAWTSIWRVAWVVVCVYLWLGRYG